MGIGAAMIAGSVVSGVAQAGAAKAAAKAQVSAADKATAAQREMFDITRQALQPFINAGTTGTANLTGNFDQLTAPISMSQEDLENTPGYKFTLGQGLKSVLNSNIARGLGSSGAALKGAAEYATGLSDATYNTRFEQELANRGLKLNTLLDLMKTGENAAAGLGVQATQTGANIGSNAIGAGNAIAASDIAVGKSISGIGDSILEAYLAKNKLSTIPGVFAAAR